MDPSKSKSQYERKLARQRQMELMEAAASGTAPSMELDTSGLVEGSNLRSRESGIAPMIPSAQQQGQMRQSQLFERPGGSRQSVVNLMDHDAGIYQEQQGLGAQMKALLFGEYDASPADDYVGQRPRRSKRLNTCYHAFCISLRNCNTKRTWIILFVMFSVVAATVVSVELTKKVPEQILRAQNSERLDVIMNQLLASKITSASALSLATSPESRALRWISYSDPQRLDPNDPYVQSRYALAVFYYTSFDAFQRVAGHQDINETDLVQTTPNPGWSRRDYWMSEKGYCTWHGVDCRAKDGADGKPTMHYDENADIMTVKMDNNDVHGSIPFEFRALTSMEYLDLSFNKLTGTFPYQIGRMFGLKHIVLDNNMMTGTLPTFMGQLEQIRELRMGNNRFVGTIPSELGGLQTLRDLSLESNALTGPIPDTFNNPTLLHLWLNNNKLSGPIPKSLENLNALNELYLQYNQLTGPFPDALAKIPNLYMISLYNNLLTGSLDNATFAELTNVQILNLQFNNFTSTVPYSLGGLKHLEELYLNNNAFSSTLPVWGGATRLRILHMNSNRLSNEIPSSYGQLLNLEELWMNDNHFTGVLPPQIGNCTQLRQLFVDNNELQGTIPIEYSTLTVLESFRINGNPKLTGPISNSVCSLSDMYVAAGALKSFYADCSLKCQCCHTCQ
jgi:Leucine-rich repeat (LRR) protein